MIKVRKVDRQDDHAWFDLEPGDYYRPKNLSLEGRGDIQLVLMLPNGEAFLVDGGWNVTGDEDTLTITPSLFMSPGAGKPTEWHGWVTNGMLRE